ncbi:HNH endonuclease signature motif containing protein [Candidatus Binatus sp.]|uniref:HNH endonuclease signature motif containing protein n=1 Tax=Candidatus Binatus sp. TaxID=2811406 RepID=UPI003C59F893
MAHEYRFAAADEHLKLSVWSKGKIADGYNGNFYRRDVFGQWMQYSAHGETLSHFGWEIAYINPVEKGGTDELSNLQPLQWQNNRRSRENKG